MNMITTTKGMMDADILRKNIDVFEDENELTQAVEYYDGDELVHRSVHVQLKKNIVGESIAAQF